MSRQRVHKKPMSQINVVPFIDVMLVLLVIFMITAPLLNQGVEVSLPQADAEVLPQQDAEPLVVSVDVDGNYYLSVGADDKKPIDLDTLGNHVAAVIRQKPKTPVLVKGDKGVIYDQIIYLMVYLKKAGVEKVGLSTDPAAAAPER